MINLSPKLIASDQVANYWPQCAPLLAMGLSDSEGEIGVEHLLQLLMAEQGFLLMGVDADDTVHAAMAMQFQKFPHYTVAHIFSIGGRGSATIITSQLPLEHWHAWMGDATVPDAILDRFMQKQHRFNSTGEPLRPNAQSTG